MEPAGVGLLAHLLMRGAGVGLALIWSPAWVFICLGGGGVWIKDPIKEPGCPLLLSLDNKV